MKRSLSSGLAALLLTNISSLGQLAGDYHYLGYEIGFSGEEYSGCVGNRKNILADQGEISITSGNTFSGTISGMELIRQITNVETIEVSGERRYFSAFSVTNETIAESVAGSVSIENGLVLQVTDNYGSFPFYFNTMTNVAIAFAGIENEQGSDEMGLGLLIRKGSGLSNAAAKGTYAGFAFGHNFATEGINGSGNVERLRLETLDFTFNGISAFSGGSSEWEVIRTLMDEETQLTGDRYVDITVDYEITESTTPLAGTYAVQDNGGMTISVGDNVLPMQMSADGNLTAAIMPNGEDNDLSLILFLKQPTNMPSSVSAVYFLGELIEEFDTKGSEEYANDIELGRTCVFLKLDNTFSIRSDSWARSNHLQNYRMNIGPPSDQISLNQFQTFADDKRIELRRGAYTIAPSGVITLTFSDGGTGSGQISANGEYFLTGFSYEEGPGQENGRDLIFGVRRHAPSPSPSVVLSSDIMLSSTGVIIQATAASGTTVEAIYTENLKDDEWRSAGTFTEDGGTITIVDPSATNAAARYYTTTFQPW
jgi:hypothetical protein